MRIISDDGHRASARAVGVVRLVSMADSRTERLRLLLTVLLVCTYPAIIDVCRLSKEINVTLE